MGLYNPTSGSKSCQKCSFPMVISDFIPYAILLIPEFSFPSISFCWVLLFLNILYSPAFITIYNPESLLSLSSQSLLLSQTLPRAQYKMDTTQCPIDNERSRYAWSLRREMQETNISGQNDKNYNDQVGVRISVKDILSFNQNWRFMVKEGFLEDVMLTNHVCARHFYISQSSPQALNCLEILLDFPWAALRSTSMTTISYFLHSQNFQTASVCLIHSRWPKLQLQRKQKYSPSAEKSYYYKVKHRVQRMVQKLFYSSLNPSS